MATLNITINSSDAERRLERLSTLAASATAAGERARTSFAGIGSSATSASAQITKINTALDTTGKVAEASGRNMMGMIPHVAAVTAAYMAMRAALRGVTAAFMEVATFDLEMKRVSAATSATAEEFKRLKDAALEATKATIFTATDSAKALKELALAGFDVNQSIKALPGVLQLATTEEMGLAKATEYATNILNAFGLSVEEIGRVNDVLAVTSAKTSTNLAGLGQAMKYAAPLGSQLGYSIEEVSAMLGVMAQQGIKGGQSGRVLQQAFVRTTKIANELGMDINSGLISVLKELDVRHTSAAKIAEMFGQVALKGILALKSNLDGYHELLDLLAKSEGAMQKMVDRIHAGLIPQLQMLKSVMSVMAIEVASAFEDDLVNAIKEMRISLDEASPEIQSFAITFIESIRDIINDWTPLASMIVDDIARIGKAIDEFGSKTGAGTENLMAAGGYGLIGRIVFGSWGPAAIAAGIKMISGEMDAYAKRLKDAKNATDTEKALSGIIEEFFTIDGLLKNLYKGITEVPKIILSITGAQQVQQVLDSQIKEIERKLLASNQYLAMLDSPIGKSLGISDDQLRAEIDKAKKEIDGLLAKIDQLKNKAAGSEATGSPAAAQVDTAMTDLWLSFASGMTAADARIKPIIDNMITKASGVMEDYEKRITKSAELGLSNRIKILENERDEVLKSAEILGVTSEEKAKYISNYSKLIAEEYAKVDARTDKATNATLTYNAAIADLNSKIAAFEGDTYASKMAKIEEQYLKYTKTLKGSTTELKTWRALAEQDVNDKAAQTIEELNSRIDDFLNNTSEYTSSIKKISEDYDKFAKNVKTGTEELERWKSLATADAGFKSIFEIIPAGKTSSFPDDPVKRAEEMAQAMRNMYEDMGESALGYHDMQISLLDKQAERYKEMRIDQNLIDQWYESERNKMAANAVHREFADRESAFASMKQNFSAMAALYAEDSRERQALSAASKAAAIAEMAVQAQKNIMIAVGAVAQQGTGDPYTAFARIAAMIAVMSSVLSMAGIAFGGGSSGGAGGTVSAGTAASQGASGRLGAEMGVGSESIANSIELMQDTYDMENLKLTKIYNELRNLNDNIIGMLTSIIRTGGISVGGYAETTTIGPQQQAWEDFGNYINIAAGTLLDPITGAMNALLGGLIGSVVGAVFGGDTKTTLQWAGIEIGDMLVSEILAGVQVSARQFASYHKETSGGWFGGGSDERWTEYSALDSQVTEALTMVFKSMSDTLVYLAEGLGTDVQAVYDYIFKGGQIDLKDQTTEQMTKTLNDYFNTLMDTAVYDLFGEILLKYQKIDEGLLETAIRLIRDKEVILTMLEMTGHAFVATDAFSATEEEAIALSQALIALAGDLETLVDAANSYYENFTTDAKKHADLTNQLNKALSEMNMTLPSTRDGYAALVEGLDLNTEEGKEAYVALLMLADASDRYYSSLEEATKIVNDIYEYYRDMIGLSNDLEKEIQSINETFAEAIAAATLLGMSEEGLSELRNAEAEVIAKAIEDYWKSAIDYYNDLMGNTNALENQINEINKAFEEYIKTAEALGLSTEALSEAQANAVAKVTEEYWQGAIDYYNDLMNNTTALEKQINSINKAFEEYIKTAEAAGLSTEALAEAQANAIAKVYADWMYSLVMPFINIAASLYGWAQGQVGVSTFDQANTQYEIKLAMIAASGDDAQTQFENNVNALQEFFTTIITGLQQTYEALKSMKATLAQDIEDIRVAGMSTTEQATFYATRAVEGYNAFSGMIDEDIPDAVEKVRSDVLKYYDLEKQIIEDKYNTEISAIKEKHTVELQNIEAIRDKLLSLTYSAYNLALPGQKATSAAGDYASIFAAAQTGDADSVSKYLSFVDTYLKASQDAYKSSQTYLDIYAKVMADIASLDKNPTATIEDLTNEQNRLIEEQTKAMAEELAALDQNVIDALEAIDATIDTRIQSVADDIVTVMNLLLDVISTGFTPTAPPQTGGVGYGAQGMTPSEIQAFYQDSNSILADNVVTTNELLLYGISSQYNQMDALIKLNTTMVDYLYWIGIAGYDLNRAMSIPGYAEGGIATGPESGYVATLHGTELVVSPKNSVPVRMSGGGYNDPEIKELLKTLVVQGGKKQNVVLTIDGKTITGVMEVVADRLDQNRIDKNIRNQNYR